MNQVFQNVDARGRLDVALVRLAEMLVKRRVEPALGGVSLWDRGLGEIVAAGVHDLGVPAVQLTPVDMARMVGILPRKARRGNP